MFRATYLALAALGLTTTGAAAPAGDAPRTGEQPRVIAGAVIKGAKGKTLGTFQLEAYGRGKSRVTVHVRGLTPGFHGVHLHGTGVCDPKSIDPATGSPFASAGDHLGHGKTLRHPAIGDFPPLLVNSDGTAYMTVVIDRIPRRRLADRDGSAVIIHAKPDNLAHIPDRYTHPEDSTGTKGPDEASRRTGDAGARVGCGVIEVVD